MLLVSAVDVALGWATHTFYMARHHWTLRREGALGAAALVALIGVVDTARLHHGADQPASTVLAVTASVAPDDVAPASLPTAALPAQAPAPAAAPPIGPDLASAQAPVDPVAAMTTPGTLDVPASTPADPSPTLAEVAPATVPTIPSEPEGTQDAIARQLASDKPFTDPIATGSIPSRPRKVRAVRPVRRAAQAH